MDSILTSVKKMLGADGSYDAFDLDIIVHINSVFMILNQMGVGPPEGFSITGIDETWQQYFGDQPVLEGVKTYMYMKVRLLFDPPASSFVLSAMKEHISEFEFRLNVAAESEVL